MRIGDQARQVPRLTSYGSQAGDQMSLKAGNFSFQARTAQNRLRMGKYSTYLEFCRSHEALALAIGSGSENLTRTRPAQNPEEIK